MIIIRYLQINQILALDNPQRVDIPLNKSMYTNMIEMWVIYNKHVVIEY